MPNINGLKSIPLKRQLRSKDGNHVIVAANFAVPIEVYDQLVKESMTKGITINMMIKLITWARYGAVTLMGLEDEDEEYF